MMIEFSFIQIKLIIYTMKILGITVAVLSLISFSACSKCKVCTKESAPEVRICEKDYNNKTEYGLAVDAQEFAGYECHESL